MQDWRWCTPLCLHSQGKYSMKHLEHVYWPCYKVTKVYSYNTEHRLASFFSTCFLANTSSEWHYQQSLELLYPQHATFHGTHFMGHISCHIRHISFACLYIVWANATKPILCTMMEAPIQANFPKEMLCHVSISANLLGSKGHYFRSCHLTSI
jgi:hypothetical protein